MCAHIYADGQLVWGVFKEVRRPQAALVQDLIAGVLHPDLFSMPELIGDASSMGQVGAHSFHVFYLRYQMVFIVV